MYRIIVFIIIIATVIWFFTEMMEKKGKLIVALKGYFESLKSSFGELKRSGSLKPSSIISNLKVLLFFIGMICVLVLGITGFIPYIFFGQPLSGFTLVLHASVAPVFGICMTALTLLLAFQHLFNKTDWQVLSGGVTDEDVPVGILKYRTAAKILFWLTIVLTPLVMGSIIVSMYPVFGTHGQEMLLIIHRITALFFLIAGIAYTFSTINSIVPVTEKEKVKDETITNKIVS